MAPKKDKMKEDLSPLVDKQIPESISLAKVIIFDQTLVLFENSTFILK